MSRRGWAALVVVVAVCGVMVVAIAILQSRRHQQAIDQAREQIAALQWPPQFDDSKPVFGCEQTSHRLCFRVVGEAPADAAAAAAKVLGVEPTQVRQIGTPPVFVYAFNTTVSGQPVRIGVMDGPKGRLPAEDRFTGSVMFVDFQD